MDWIEVKGDGSIPTDMSKYKVWQYKLRAGFIISAGPTNCNFFFTHHGDSFDVVAVKPEETETQEAYNRFRESPRGRKALTMIGKPPSFISPLGEEGVIREIVKALKK